MSGKERKWSLRAFRDGDQEGILELYKVVYPEREYDRDKWMKWWQWMYRDNPNGKGIVWLAVHDGKVVGQYAIVPRRMKVGSQSVAGALSLDTMTHPGYRRQGIFETLAKAVYEEAGRDGIHIVHGFPNEFSYPGFVTRLDWFYVDTMGTLLKPLNWRNALTIAISNRLLLMIGALTGNLVGMAFSRGRKAPAVEGLIIAQVPSFDERINEFWAKLSHQYRVMVERNREYLNWRYVDAPDSDYLVYIAERGAEVVGYLVLHCMQMGQASAAIIFDILAESEEIAQCLIAEAVERSKRERVDLVYYASVGGSSVPKAFRRNGFMHFPSVKRLRFCAYSTSSCASREFLQNRGNWFIQMGDSDMM